MVDYALIEYLLQDTIAFKPAFAHVGGSINAGLFLSQLWYWKDRGNDPDGWIYKSAEDWERETMLTKDMQLLIRKRLRGIGVLEEKKKGIPPTMRFRLNISMLYDLIDKHVQLLEKETSNSWETQQLMVGKPNVYYRDYVQRLKTENKNSPLSYYSSSFSEAEKESEIRHSPAGKDCENSILEPKASTHRDPNVAIASTEAYSGPEAKPIGGGPPNPLMSETKSGGGPPHPLFVSEGKKGGKATEYSEGFLAFWALYPRKKSKAAAYKAWIRQKCDPQYKPILEAVRVDKALKRAEEFVPYPATWLNQRTWEEEGMAQDRERDDERNKAQAAYNAWKIANKSTEKNNANL